MHVFLFQLILSQQINIENNTIFELCKVNIDYEFFAFVCQ